MDKRLLIYFGALVFLISSCQTGAERTADSLNKQTGQHRDLDAIKKDGKLKVLTTYSGTSYFLYRGEPMGFEYELLQRFAHYLEVELEIFISGDIDSLFYELNQGDFDLVAHGLTVTTERKTDVKFTDYLYLTHQVLVQKKPDDYLSIKWDELERSLIHDAIELIGDTVSVRYNSSYYPRLQNLSDEIGGKIIIDTLSGDLSTDKIIEMVADGEVKYTVADDNLAGIYASYYPILDVEVPISFSQRIAWAVHPGSVMLLDSLNAWLGEMKKHTDYYVIYNKYFKNERGFRKRIQSDFYSLNENKISRYDEEIKTYANELGWDWRLLASLVFQESRFNPSARSWAGAVGLMQMMPSAAKEMGVKNRADPNDNLRGGSRYLKKMWSRFDSVTDSAQRIKFTMAAYNCGYNHVVDAQNFAESKGLDKYLWDGNVAEMIVELSYPENYNSPLINYGYVKGIEPFTYVEQIFDRFEHFKKFIKP